MLVRVTAAGQGVTAEEEGKEKKCGGQALDNSAGQW